MSTFQFLLFRTMHLLKNISTLPNTCSKHTNNILDTIIFSKEDIYKIIKNLDPNKAHGHDMISIRMIKLCGISICKPLNNFSNVVSTFKKDDKQCIKNYRPFDDGHEVRGVFLDISKAFDRVCHEGLLLKLQQNGISRDLISLVKDFLSCRKQRVV